MYGLRSGIRMKHRINHTFLWLLIYELIAISAIFFEDKMDIGLTFIIPVIMGNIVLFLASRKTYKVNYFEHNKKMTVPTFFAFLGLLLLLQGLTSWIMVALDLLGVTGTSIDAEFDSFWFIIYAALVGPVGEELAFRGFTQGNLKYGGRIAAIVLSAISFGLMHGNLSQFLLGTLVGLTFGYFAMEYSIWWTILMHIINNFLLNYCIKWAFPEDIHIWVYNGLYTVLGAVGIAICYFRRDIIKEFFTREENKLKPGFLKDLFTSVWFYIYLVTFVAIIILLMVFGVEI